ncbi:metalloregulator ArsR/SmtB family transcription factor [Ciceribacter sp. L1K22]|uniref:ArsR/SmtB family transcription factor n=1 Tax=Ciceribacter sp. L1K22 TaxID=2820275 RepID=UPI001ABE88EF|nr:metalloregulator ArsR/SmtB family transcription factor [Ciceribacter sp. L1K22]MBO3760434.1 winged helix-turn-helix transcriptional regulator [Ciceribacter sp. L1K22]
MTYPKALITALADDTRRHLFERLAAKPSSVADLARALPVSQPAVSQHLKVLREAGLVTHHEEGRRRIYAIDPQGLGPLRAWLDQFWDEQLAAFKQAVEREDET